MPETTSRLAANLEHGLDPVNPIDVWATGYEHERIAEACFGALVDDPGVGQAVFASNMPGGRALVHTWARVAERVHRATTKPVMMLGNLSSAFDRGEAAGLRSLGIPVLLETRSGLNAIAGSIAWHRFRRERRPPALPAAPSEVVAAWKDRAKATNGASLDPAESLALAADFGVMVVPSRVVCSAEEAVAGADALC